MWTAIMPDGPYLVEVLSVGDRRVSMSGHHLYTAQLRWVGTDRDLWTFFSSAPQASYRWYGIVEDFEDLPTIVGRRFIADIGSDEYKGETRNRVKDLLVEVLDA